MMVKKKTTKKTVKKKTSSKKQQAEFSDYNKTVLTCIYCNSPSIHKAVLNSKEHYYCLRCGKHHLHVNEKPLAECKELHKTRKTFTKIAHSMLKDEREHKLYVLIDNFYLRMGFRMASLLLIIGGGIFSFSDFWTGMLFLVVGLVSLWTAESL